VSFMRAVTVVPERQDSIELTDMPEPPVADGPVVVETQAVGICGTDLEIVNGEFGSPPPGDERLILGHESLGRVLEAPDGSGLSRGDLVVGIVRRRDPVPCLACAAGEWDMCTNGRYTERGIKARHGFASERFRSHPENLVKVDASLGELGVLLEPTSVVAKAWDHIERIGRRASWGPRTVLVTGAGPIGLLAGLLSVQRGFDTHVFDRATDGPKPALVAELGATYHHGDVAEVPDDVDIVIECTGFAQLLLDAGDHEVHNRITCLTGVSAAGVETKVDAGLVNRRMVLQNGAVFGSVNANRRHYEQASDALAGADRRWLDGLITRRVPIERWSDAYARHPDDIKTILQFGSSALPASPDWAD
jgi:threonine dehydrogenase-like Zn-dependent dehydrogenase